ncbi:PREDICTED: delta(3,5)-Delta(2,4)-dienoyl-CoA isomerase, mitochondrial-like, partial [Thamnophis sirtalis]|uniref:Delta(3,5)-Delta(2,4)-dienoyl-CoA isomerase, mitochondrial-like n=1 Tax=Thamnophis sirtalis TaxID=35019 RepID=A0A6I9Z3R3_9SAUR
MASKPPQQQQQQPPPNSLPAYETLKLERVREKVLHVELNRPEKRNAMNVAFWREMVECFNKIAQDSECHAVVISGAGKMFTSGKKDGGVTSERALLLRSGKSSKELPGVHLLGSFSWKGFLSARRMNPSLPHHPVRAEE